MAEYLRMLREQFDRLSTVQKRSIGGVALVALLATGILLFTPAREDTVRLFGDLDLKETAGIRSRLDALGIPYRISDGGTAIHVPRASRDQALVALAENDQLPQRSPGFGEIIGLPSALNQSKEVLDVNILRALQGEIEKTVKSFPAVAAARVHLNRPEKSLFTEDAKPDKASVQLTLRPGQRLEPRQVKAIRAIIANAAGIDPEHITIVDAEMNDLTDLIEDPKTGAALSQNQQDMQAKLARDLEKKVKEALNRILGADRYTVTVTAELNFDEVDEERKELRPPIEGEETGVPVSRRTVDEAYEGQAPLAGGEPGVNPNVPPTYPGARKGATKYTKAEKDENIDYNETKTRTKKAVGSTIRRLSVAAMVDDVVPEAQLPSLRDYIKSAVGLDERRGDSLSVSRIPFNRGDAKAAEARARKERLQEMIAKIAIVAIPVFLLLLIFVVLWRRWEAKVEELEPEMLDLSEIKEPEERVEEEEPEEELDPVERARQDKVVAIREMAHANPDGISKLLQLWLAEE